MKNKILFAKLTVVMVALLTLVACGDDDKVYVWGIDLGPNATVTVKLIGDDAFYMQLDDSTTLYATNITEPPFGNKEMRAFVNYREVENIGNGYSKTVYVNYIDSILTKNSVVYQDEESAEVYGDDPIEIVPAWFNVVEDGYLTMCFRTLWGTSNIPHYVNLLTGVNPDDPYEVEFRHNAYGDVDGKWGYGVVSFKLQDMNFNVGEKDTVTLKYNSFSGEKTVKFGYSKKETTSEDDVSIESVANTSRLR
ncbi:MAG: NigD-like protein [Prevotella sp.]|nr:NigD-like protein [Prevotella sp.]